MSGNPYIELDRFIAKRAMGWKQAYPDLWSDEEGRFYYYTGSSDVTPHRPFRPSSDISEAWPLAEEYKLTLIPLENNRWFAGCYDLDHEFFDSERGIIDGHFSDGTYAVAGLASLAICEAVRSIIEKKSRKF